MVGTTVIGDGKISARTLPPEARALNRFFRLLEDPIVIREAMSDVLDKAPSSVAIDTIRSMLTSTLIKLEQFENRKDRIFEHKAAHGINLLVESSFADASIDLESLGSHQKATKLIATSGPASIGGSGSLGGHSLMSTNEKFTDAASIAMVSDSVSVSHGSRTERQPEALRTISAFWAYLLEAIHLQVVSRTTRIWGRKKIYEIYRLNGPVSHHKSLEQIRVDLLNEFRAIYSDIECRTYGLQRLDGNIFLHLVIGPPFDYTDERNRSQSGEKKKKKANEFIFIVNPGSNLMAVTASRAPSKSRFVKFVLTAADLALVATDKRAQNVVYEAPSRVVDFCGTEPMDLLHAAYAADTGQATGRFSHIATEDEAHLDPLVELQEASSRCLVDRTRERARLQTAAHHGRPVGQEAAAVATQIDGAALALSSITGVVIDHEASTKQDRIKLRGMTFGEGGPQLKKLRFKWSGETTAMSDFWKSSERKAVRSKCAFSFVGIDVLEGLRELLVAGKFQTPLPQYVYDAPTAGTSTIVVRDGAMVTEK